MAVTKPTLCMNEVATTETPHCLRRLFVTVVTQLPNNLSNSLSNSMKPSKLTTTALSIQRTRTVMPLCWIQQTAYHKLATMTQLTTSCGFTWRTLLATLAQATWRLTCPHQNPTPQVAMRCMSTWKSSVEDQACMQLSKCYTNDSKHE